MKSHSKKCNEIAILAIEIWNNRVKRDLGLRIILARNARFVIDPTYI